jgi:hypothetical protein
MHTLFCTCRHLLLLGTYNFAYNLASQLVLANVAVVSHGMMELFKRIFVLVAAAVLLQVRGGNKECHSCCACLGLCQCIRISHNAPVCRMWSGSGTMW